MSVRSSLGRKRRMPATDKEVTSPTESRTALSDVLRKLDSHLELLQENGSIAKRMCLSPITKPTHSDRTHENRKLKLAKHSSAEEQNRSQAVGTLKSQQLASKQERRLSPKVLPSKSTVYQDTLNLDASNDKTRLSAFIKPAKPSMTTDIEHKLNTHQKAILSRQQLKVTRENYETRPWRRLLKEKKFVNGHPGKWYYDTKTRESHSSDSDEIALTSVYPSTRNKKQHLRQPEDDDDDAAIVDSFLSQERSRSFDHPSTFRVHQSSPLRVRGEDSVHQQEEDFVYVQEEGAIHAPILSFDSMDGSSESDEDAIEYMDTKCLQLTSSINKVFKHAVKMTKQLQADKRVLVSENKKKDALIRKLERQHHKTTKEAVKRCIGDLEWRLLYKPDGQLEVLGKGSYGKVYKAFSGNAGTCLAAKVVLDLSQKYIDVLEKEVKQLSTLKPHKRIVTYFGTCYAKHPCFDNEKSLFVFTEFMPGGSLSSYLERNGPLTQEVMWHYTKQILEGVEYLHKCRIIHRDIKGSNIMRDQDGNVKLADFGSAKQICSESLNTDKTKYLYGTAPWAAPELLRREKARPGSDIWSVAATIVEMLTGETPYKTENQSAIVYQVGSNKINPLTSMKKGGYELDFGVEAFLSICFDSDAKERPSAAVLLKIVFANCVVE